MARQRLGSQKKKDWSRMQHIMAWGIIAGIIAILVLVVMVLRRPFLQMEPLTISGNEIVSDGDIYNELNTILDTYWMGLVPRTSIFAFTAARIQEHLQESLPRLDDISVRRTGLRTATIRLTEYLPAYLWCHEEESEIEGCYYVGRDGFVFSPAPSFSDYVFVKFYDELYEGSPLRTFVFSEEDFSSIIDVRRRLERIDVHMYYARQGEARDYRIGISHIGDHVMGSDAYIYINLNMSLDETMRALEIVLAQDRFQSRLDAGDVLEYIDIRFEGRVLFKFRE